MEIVIIVLLTILIALFLWYILRGQRQWKEQGNALSKAVGERIDGTLTVFGDLRDKLGQLAEKTRIIEETGKNISNLQEILRAPKPRGGLGELLLERLLADSVENFYEIGPGRVLTGLMRRINRKTKVINVSSAASVKDLL